MLSIDTRFFVSVPDESRQRILHPATVIEVDQDTYVAELEEKDIPLGAEQPIVVYYEIRGEFMQQPGTVTAYSPADTQKHDRVSLTTSGQPVSAESRQCYRVSTVTADMAVAIDGDDHCPLTDVSVTGLSFISANPYEAGKIVPVRLEHDRASFEGGACVQSTKPLGSDRTRYGLYCVEQRADAGNLNKGLNQISMAVQREQLRRLARAS